MLIHTLDIFVPLKKYRLDNSIKYDFKENKRNLSGHSRYDNVCNILYR